MDIYRINTLGNIHDRELCLLEGPPEAVEEHSYCLTSGERIAPHWHGAPTIKLTDENPGMKLSSLLGNTDSFLLCSTELKDRIAQACQAVEIEYLPFVLLDHQGRVHSRDHWLINPIGTSSVLDKDHAELDGEETWMVDPSKATSVPPLFRLDVDPTVYLVRGDLAEALMASNFTNVKLERIPAKT